VKLAARIRWRHVRRFYEGAEPLLKASPVKLACPDSGRVLVLAPHIDDDVIGAGGCLRKHVELGNDVAAVYFADCTAERIREAEEAAGAIGFSILDFFPYEGKTLDGNSGVEERISSIISGYKPEIVYLPSFLDRHNDHLAVNHCLARLHVGHGYTFTVYAYEVWTAIIPNLVVDITGTIDKKKEALSGYGSQLPAHDWVEAAVSLNRFRGVTSGAGLFAEAFMRYSMGEYFDLWKKVYSG
jgi:LmbE family N-acetylglucosaminyl deacetylase